MYFSFVTDRKPFTNYLQWIIIRFQVSICLEGQTEKEDYYQSIVTPDVSSTDRIYQSLLRVMTPGVTCKKRYKTPHVFVASGCSYNVLHEDTHTRHWKKENLIPRPKPGTS